MLASSTISFLDHWQTLSGSLLGTFLAAVFALIAFYFRSKIRKQEERTEAFRRVEISLARTINEYYFAKDNINSFLARLDQVIANIKSVFADDNKYSLEETNFPIIRIFIDEELPLLRLRSYYLHNKLLWIVAGAHLNNTALDEMAVRFDGLFKRNEFLVGLKASPREQKGTAIANLESFRKLVTEEFLPSIDFGIKTMAQAKLYNNKIRERYWGRYSLWKYEGIHFKFFKNKSEIQDFRKDLGCIDRIDAIIESEVDEELAKAEKRNHEKSIRKS